MDSVMDDNPFSPQTVSAKIETPADAISATTAGLSPLKAPCITVKFLYLK